MAHEDLHMVEYGREPALLIVADGAGAEARARRAADDAGCRVADVVALASAAERIGRQVHADAILVEIDNDGGDALDAVLDRLEILSGLGRGRSVVSSPASLIDIVAARAWNGRIEQLVNSAPRERAAAVREACAPEDVRLHDLKDQPGRLQQLSQEVGRIADILANLSIDEAAEPGSRSEDTLTAAHVRTIIRARRLRDRYFGAELFADPAFDMLLDLMAHRLESQRVAVSSLCIAAAVPATTALRWIKALTDQGMFVRTADPHDGRRVFIELSDQAADRFAAYLRAVQRLSPLMV